MKLCFPVNYVAITIGYSSSHQALDLGWRDNPNVRILACFDGVVSNIYTDNQFGGGLTLSIKYNNGYSSEFKHLSKVLVKVGDIVSQFEEVAIMGDSGWAANGVHLHFNLYLNNKRVNPLEHCYLYPNQNYNEKDKNLIMFYEGTDNMKFKIGDKVIINGNLFPSSTSDRATSKVTNKITEITRIAKGTAHPYNTTGDLGWMNETAISLYEEQAVDYKSLYENEVIKNSQLQSKINGAIDILE